MTEWVNVELGNVAFIQQGKRVDHQPIDVEAHPLYGANGVIGSWHEGTYPFDVIGLGCRGSVGTLVTIPSGAWLGNNVMGIWPKDASILHLGFLRLALEVADLRSSGVISGQVQEQITRQSLSPLEVGLPSLPEQRRIVDLIGALDAQIVALDAEALRAADLLSALRSQEFGAFDTPLDLSSVTRAIRAGGTPSRRDAAFYGGDIPWLKSGEVANSWITETEEKVTPEALTGSSAWLVPAGSVVVAMYGATAAQVGYLAGPMATNQAVLAFVPEPSLCDGRFLYHWFCHHSAELKEAASGAAQPNLSKAVILREMSFPALDQSAQRQIATVLDAAGSLAQSLTREAKSLREGRTRVLDSLLSAAVKIPDSYDCLLDEAV